ncbi:MAG: carboxylating nicotinate-nucleotide diphosphorylase [Alphaproteobacteria bacterium]|nr:carboxylating nicotinate-nucleotide diphosphorylase [Alphaproteobacteria bacterium]
MSNIKLFQPEPKAAPQPAHLPLHRLQYEGLVRAALEEDLGRAGDLTTDSVVSADTKGRAALAARKPGVVAGLDVTVAAFTLLDDRMRVTVDRSDGTAVKAGDRIAMVEGSARAILTAERTALNFLCRLSGIATTTARMVAAIDGHKAHIICTRKTTPGLRTLEKYAVRVAGGMNHRFGLDDAVLIKDNHVALAGGISEAVDAVRRRAGHMVKVQVEVDTLDQLETLVPLGVDAVLLDNMDAETMRRAVALVDGRMLVEASGGVTPETVASVAATGVDLISSGALTHSVTALDIGLDIDIA